MAKINNAQIIQKLVDELKLYPGTDLIPTELADKILPVFQVNDQNVSVTRSTATVVRNGEAGEVGAAVTLFATAATGKFFLTNVAIAVHNQSIGSVLFDITITIDGTARKILLGKMQNADNPFFLSADLQNPVLIDQSTNIVLNGTNVGDFSAFGTIVGYTTVS